MLRPSRASFALIRSIMLGVAAVTTTVAASSVLVACSDDTKPEYWVEKLEDPQWRPRAVKRLTQFLDDALTRADNNIEDPAVKELEDKLVGPLTQVYVESYGDLDTKTRVTLIKLLADFRDERAVPALKKAFEEFAKRPRETKDEQDIKWAIRAYGDMKSKELGGPVLAAFEALKAHTQLGGITYKDYSKGMVDAPDPAWESALIARLGNKIKHPNSGKNKAQQRDLVDPYRDELFWQVTAAQVLGELKSQKAVEPLIQAILDPGKGDLATTALLALVKIGKPSVDRAAKVLNESDPLVAFAKKAIKEATDADKEPAGNPALASAAAIIGMAGRSDGADPLIAALEGKLSDEDKAIIVGELPKLPPSDKTKDAFKKAFSSISIDTSIQGTPALAILAEASAKFYDASMVDWMLEQAQNTKGGGESKTAVQQALISSAIKLAKADQWDKVVAAAKTYKVDDLAKTAEGVMKSCGDKVDCYLTEVEKTDNQSEKNQLAGIKAAYMIGVLGDAKARDSLVERLSSLENDAVHFAALGAIDVLSPKGAPEVVKTLEEMIEKNEKSADAGKLSKNSPLKQIAYRISVR
jgi:HEAT repeat protein